MITRLVSAFALLLILFTKAALGVVPEQGLWWNPAESGRGYGIELQDDYLFLTYYAYGAAGQSAFFTSGGRYSAITNSADLDFATFSNGQCFGCTYQGRPTGSLLGSARVSFSSPMTGELRLPGGVTIPIQRQLFFGNEARTNLYGTWHLTSGTLGIYFGELLWVQSADDSLAGGFKGRVVDGAPQRILVGAPLPSGEIAILVDSSTSYYTYYVLKWSVNRWGGRSWTYLKSSQPSGSGLLFFGSRVLGKRHSENATADAATEAKDAQSSDVADQLLSFRSQASSDVKGPGRNLDDELLFGVDSYLEMARELSTKFSGDLADR
jgi:hypothetical protein